eukprot:scaffold992_cov118-Isochrysis_galbana.AAC.9
MRWAASLSLGHVLARLNSIPQPANPLPGAYTCTRPSDTSFPSCSFSSARSLHFWTSFLPAIEPGWNWLASSSSRHSRSRCSPAFTCGEGSGRGVGGAM